MAGSKERIPDKGEDPSDRAIPKEALTRTVPSELLSESETLL